MAKDPSLSHLRDELGKGVEFRSDAPVSKATYQGYEHWRLQQMVTENLSASQVGDVAEAWAKLGDAMIRFGERLRGQLARTDTAWQGIAAENAKSYTSALAKWSDETGRCAELVSHSVARQGEAAGTAHHQMPEPVPFDVHQELASWAGQPQLLNTQVQQALERQQASQDAKDQAVTVMTEYDNNLQSAARNQPVFPQVPKLRIDAGSSQPPAAATTSASGDLPSSATSAAGYVPPGAGGGGVPVGSSGEPGQGPQVGTGRTSPSMPFHSGGAGAPSAAGLAGQGRPPASPGFMGAPGMGGRGQEDKEHTNNYVVEDWNEKEYWYDGMPRPVTPVLGADPATQQGDAKQDGAS
jgi:hypothetical protein